MKKNMHKDLGRKKIVVLWLTLVFVLGMFTPSIGSKNVKIMNSQSSEMINNDAKGLADVTNAIDSDTIHQEGPLSNPDFIPLGADAPWANLNWQYRKEITINHSKVDATLIDFPVLVSLNSDADLARNAQDDGDDIAFTNFDGGQLAHEIEYFDNDTGELLAWVKVPSLSGSVNTSLYLYYGNSSCENMQNPENVWHPNFVMVQHFHESSGTHYDSTSYGNDGSPQGILNQSAVGKIDGADKLDGSDDYVEVANNESLQLTNAISVEVWAKADSFSSYRTIAAKDDIYTFSEWWFGYNYLNKLDFKFNAHHGVSINSNTVITDSDWHHLVGVYNGSHIYVFVDGTLDSTPLSCSSIPNNVGTLNIGYTKYWNCCRFNGLIDEVRVLNASIDASWVATEYNNQNDPSTFHSVGSEETAEMKPTANFTYTPENPSTQDLIQFTDTSTDYDGTIVSWWWDFDDGTNSTLQNPTHKYADNGTYDVSLTVTDDDGAKSTVQKQIAVDNVPPVADFTYSPSNPFTIDTIQFVDTSTDYDGTIVSWWWDFDDGANSTLQNPSHKYVNDGSYEVNLTVTDDDGYEDTKIKTIVVKVNQPPKIPTVDGPKYGKIEGSYDYTFVSTDPEGENIRYYIDWGDGTIDEWIGPYASGSTESVTHTWSKIGDFQIKAKAKDIRNIESGWSEPKTVKITEKGPIGIKIKLVSIGRVSAYITNNCEETLHNIHWNISAKRDKLIGDIDVSKNGTIDELPSEGLKKRVRISTWSLGSKLRDRIVRRFGLVDITATATFDGITITETGKAFVIGRLVIKLLFRK